MTQKLHQAPLPEKSFPHIHEWLKALDHGPEFIAARTIPDVRERIITYLEKARYLRDKLLKKHLFESVLLHGDLHPENILQNGEDATDGMVMLRPSGGPPAGSGATYTVVYSLGGGTTQEYSVTDTRASGSTSPLQFTIPAAFLQSLTVANYPNGVKFEFKATLGGNSLSFGGSSFTIDKTQPAGSNNDNGAVQCPIAPVASGQTPSASANLVMGSAHSWTNIMTGGTDGILDNCEAQTNGNLKF